MLYVDFMMKKYIRGGSEGEQRQEGGDRDKRHCREREREKGDNITNL